MSTIETQLKLQDTYDVLISLNIIGNWFIGFIIHLLPDL